MRRFVEAGLRRGGRLRPRRGGGLGFVALTALPMLHAVMPAFGGENPLGGAPNEDNWHHEGLTRKAARAAGWGAHAENALAFHADYLDSYLYNPLWWFDVTNGGGKDRLRVVMSSHDDLVRLHFDDLFHPEQVRDVWHRYLAGTVAGLLWIATSGHEERVRVSMAHNLVGASLHALQDFYSHSNWIDDPARRDVTWFDLTRQERSRLSLWTGSYEEDDHLGVKPHGDYLYACTVINNLGGFARGLLRLACHAASPLSGGALCQALNACDDAVAIPVPADLQAFVPEFLRDSLVFVKPGINVDSRWMADIGAHTRAVPDLDGETAFRTAYALALRQSCQWLHALEHLMDDAGQSSFWDSVKRNGVIRRDYKRDVAPWEDLSLLPYRFISAGDYPVGEIADDEAWYLRLTIATADVGHAGTNADIVPVIDGVRMPPLDHGPGGRVRESGDAPELSALRAALGYDDFERGTVASYIIGPLRTRPSRVELLNDAPTAGDVLLAAVEAVLDAIVGVLESIRDFFLFLVGYHADFVGSDHVAIEASTLRAMAVGASRSFALTCDGRSEGRYRITGSVSKTNVTGVRDGIPWREYMVGFGELICEKESDWDRGTSSDEPFVLGLVIPHGTDEDQIAWRTGPYSNVDTGDRRDILRFSSVRIPEQFGFISLAAAVYESDSESAGDRDDLLDQFADRVATDRAPAEDAFLVTLSESIAAGWRPHHVDAVSFRRGTSVEVVRHHRHDASGWVDGGQRLSWNLTRLQTIRANVPSACDCDCPEADFMADGFPDLAGLLRDREDLLPGGAGRVRAIREVALEELVSRASGSSSGTADDDSDDNGGRHGVLGSLAASGRWDVPLEDLVVEDLRDEPLIELPDIVVEERPARPPVVRPPILRPPISPRPIPRPPLRPGSPARPPILRPPGPGEGPS